MTNLAEAAPVSAQAEPPARTSIRDLVGQTEINFRLFGMLVALFRDPARHGHLERRQADPGEQHDHDGRPGLRHRDPRDGHGPGHRHPQHRPVGRVAGGFHRDDLRDPDDRLPWACARYPAWTFPAVGSSPSGSACVVGMGFGAVQGFIIAYVGVPSFIVTLGGLLSIRGVVWYLSNGASVTGLDPSFQLIGGGAQGSLGGALTWVVGVIGCTRRRRPARVQPETETSVRVPAAPDVGRDPARGARLRRHPRACLVRQPELLAQGSRCAVRQGQQHPGAAGRSPDLDRIPVSGRAADRRDAGDELHRDATPLRPLRVRLRRQSGRGRAGRHQHALDDPQDLHADGRSCARSRPPSLRLASTDRRSTSASATSCT